jgi:hypothetical protein
MGQLAQTLAEAGGRGPSRGTLLIQVSNHPTFLRNSLARSKIGAKIEGKFVSGVSEFGNRVVFKTRSSRSKCPHTLSGPIKSESPNSLINRGVPKIRESKNQGILSRFSPNIKIHESTGQMRMILRSVLKAAR